MFVCVSQLNSIRLDFASFLDGGLTEGSQLAAKRPPIDIGHFPCHLILCFVSSKKVTCLLSFWSHFCCTVFVVDISGSMSSSFADDQDHRSKLQVLHSSIEPLLWSDLSCQKRLRWRHLHESHSSSVSRTVPRSLVSTLMHARLCLWYYLYFFLVLLFILQVV